MGTIIVIIIFMIIIIIIIIHYYHYYYYYGSENFLRLALCSFSLNECKTSGGDNLSTDYAIKMTLPIRDRYRSHRRRPRRNAFSASKYN